MEMKEALALIREVPDFPKPGILFLDITPALANSEALTVIIQTLAKEIGAGEIIAGIEARGFILGAGVAVAENLGFVPIRKKGNLPSQTYSVQYGLEYGVDEIEVHIDALLPGQRVVILDDVLATGGTLRAAIELVEKCGAIVEKIVVLIEIAGLSGRGTIEKAYPNILISAITLI